MANNKNSDILRYGVVIIESLQEEDIHTGTNLFQNLLRYKHFQDDKFYAEIHTVNGRDDFFDCFQKIKDNIEEHSTFTIHIESHGGEKGLQLASSEIVSWPELHSVLRPINVALKGLLAVSIATCYSFPFLWCIDITQRASFRTVTFTKKDMTTDEIERGFESFFGNYYNILDIFQATESIQNEVNEGDPHWSPFQTITAEWAFDQISDPDNNPNFQALVMRQYAAMRNTNPSLTPRILEEDIRRRFKFIRENGKNYFLLKDLYT